MHLGEASLRSFFESERWKCWRVRAGLDIPEAASKEEGAFSPIGFGLLSEGEEATVKV